MNGSQTPAEHDSKSGTLQPPLSFFDPRQGQHGSCPPGYAGAGGGEGTNDGSHKQLNEYRLVTALQASHAHAHAHPRLVRGGVTICRSMQAASVTRRTSRPHKPPAQRAAAWIRGLGRSFVYFVVVVSPF